MATQAPNQTVTKKVRKTKDYRLNIPELSSYVTVPFYYVVDKIELRNNEITITLRLVRWS